MTKKILALIVALTICLSFTAQVTTFASSSPVEAMSMLDALNIGDFTSADKTVTRGEFAGAISDIINYNNRPAPKDGHFSDVGASNPHSGAIYSISDMKIISGYADGSFGANDPVLFDHAVKMLVSALGYDVYAKNYGGYPTGYLRVAQEKDILSGVSAKSGEALSQGDAAILVANALDVDVLIQTAFGDSFVYEAFEGRTLLTEYAKIKKVEGIISDNGITSLLGETKTAPGKVIIDGAAYDEGNSGASHYLGYNVSAYVSDSKNGSNEIVYLNLSDEINVEVILAERLLPDDEDFSLKNIVYEDVYGKTAYAKLDSEADFIYNGKAHPDITADDLSLEFGKIILIDNDGNNRYEVVLIEESRIFAVSGTNVSKNVVYPFGESALILDTDYEAKIYRDGVECTIDALSQWDVVNAEISLDGSVIILRASSKKLSGVVDSYISSTNTVAVNGKYYHVNTDELMERITLGKSYEFCMDINGNIADIRSLVITNEKVGILMAAKRTSGLSSVIRVKIFTSDGLVEIYNLSEKASIDNVNSRTPEEAEAYLGADSSSIKYGIISYKLNSDNEIIEIKSPSAAQNESDLKLDYTTGSSKIAYSGYQFSLGGKVVMDTNTKVFKLPQDLTDDDRYMISNRNSFLHEKQYSFSAYSIGEDRGFVDYIVYSDTLGATYTSAETPVIISEISSVLDIDGMPTQALKGYNQDGEVKYTSETNGMFDELKPGDIIRCLVNDKSEILNFEIILDIDTMELNSAITTNADKFTGAPRFTTFDVYKKVGDVFTLSREELTNDVNESTLNTEKMVYNKQKIYVFDADEKETVTAGTVNDIFDYKSVGEDCSKIFVYSHYGSLKMIIVFSEKN